MPDILITCFVPVFFLSVVLAGCDKPALSRSSGNIQDARSTPAIEKIAAAPGRVEGRSASVEIGAAADGVLKSVHVKEGQHVKAGDLLAELDCIDRRAAIGVAEAEVAEAASKLAVVQQGPRGDDLAAATARKDAAEVEFTDAATYLSRMASLAAKEDISRVQYDQAALRRDTAAARVREARAQIDRLKDGASQEERAQAKAAIDSAAQRLSQAKARVDQCQVVSPQSGVILRLHAREGEPYSTFIPRPLFEIVDDSQRRVRAEVDQRDSAAIFVGQSAEVAVAESSATCPATVANIARRMGRQRIYKDDAPEPKDRDVLEAVLTLDKCGAMAPIGLRVTVIFKKR